jgi:hypothetical protein
MRHLCSLLSGLAVPAAGVALFAIDHRDLSAGPVLGRIVVAGLLLGPVATTRMPSWPWPGR